MFLHLLPSVVKEKKLDVVCCNTLSLSWAGDYDTHSHKKQTFPTMSFLSEKTTSSGKSCQRFEGDRDESHAEHLKLAGVVKGVHAKLRKKYRESGDFDKIWNEHCQDERVLSDYADAMHHLAVDHWTQRPETRIHWCREMCHKYFLKDGLMKALEKDIRRKRHESLCTSGSSQADETSLLDEGSENESLQVNRQSWEGCNGAGGSGSPFELELLKSPPTRCPIQKIRARAIIPRVEIDFEDRKENVFKNSPDGLMAFSPRVLETFGGSPSSGDPLQGSWPPKDVQKNPLEKCNDYMQRMELNSEEEPLSQGSSGKSADSNSGDMELEKQAIYAKYGPVKYNSITLPFEGRIRLLDVGSCYNPFIEFDEFLSVGIDISPAVESVHRCDFLCLDTPEPLQLARDTIDTILSTLPDPVTRLPRDTFHVVVFSLLLEYFPSAYQRWLCCQKAHSLLMMNGLLLIITPDSQHQNKNAAMMKSWKRAIQSMGFKRFAYEKQEHLHCMAFRKVAPEGESNLLLGDTNPDMLYIPQDFSEPSTTGFMDEHVFDCLIRSEDEDLLAKEAFQELPDFTD